MRKRPRSSICISLADKQQCILIPGENTPQACYWSQQSCPSKKPTPCSFPLGREYSLLRARSIFCFVRQLVAVQIVFWAAKHGSFSLLVFLCVLYSLFIKLDCQLPQDSIGGFVFCSASSNRSSFPQKQKWHRENRSFLMTNPSTSPVLQRAVPSRYHFSTARALYYNARRRFGTARALYYNARYRLSTASVPLGPSITMRGAASVPLRYRSGPLLQCAVPTPRLRFTKF